MKRQKQNGSNSIRMRRQTWIPKEGIHKLSYQMPLQDLQEGGQQRGLREELNGIDKDRRREEGYSDTSRRSRRNGSTRTKDKYHNRQVTESDIDTGTGTDESSKSRWKMNTDSMSYLHWGKKHDDPDVHIQAFEQYAELKHILKEEWGEYFPHTLKEAARKWYYHYPASKLQSYKKLKKAFILEYTDGRGDEDILCELDKIKQGKLSVKKYVQKIKELTRRLNESPSEKRMRA
ncbi:hypothetical protein L7F22_057440 [Adiantum nelumboides]|nr:hypothetical protein [Adiantum nelumboides]